MTKVRTYEDENLSERQKIGIEETPLPAGESSGVNQAPLIEPIPIFNHANGETTFSGKSNTYIVMGRDRPAGLGSGYGSEPNSHSGCIDIIAGLSGPLVRETFTDMGTTTKAYTNKSTVLDAARIYISQRCDIDRYFYCPLGKVGDSEGKSGIAIKADAIRIIGREGVKIWAGGDKYTSRGPKAAAVGIDLIGGTGDLVERRYIEGLSGEGLQPLVKGNNLIKALSEMVDWVEDSHDRNQVEAIDHLLQQVEFSIHVHPCATIPPVTAPTPSAIGIIYKAYKFWNAFYGLSGVYSRTSTMANITRFRLTYLNTNSKDCILSEYNTTN